MTVEPIRLQHRLVYVSSQDDKFGESLDAVDLAVRNGEGWISSKYCHFPQELVLRLQQNSTVERIHLLCHHVFIPTQLDVSIGHAPGDSPSWMNATYEKLGTVSFQDNAESGYKSRELKIVRVDSSGTFVKLSLHENHKNEYNPFSQVALINITIFGYPNGPKHSNDFDADFDSSIPHPMSPISHGSSPQSVPNSMRIVSDRGRRPPVHQPRSYAGTEPLERRSPNDLLVMNGTNHIQEMRTIEHMLDVKKKMAVRDEHFDEAKQLKLAMDRVQVAIDRIDQVNKEKRSAIEEENYDKAEHYKREMDAIRIRTYEEIGLWHLLTEKEQKDLGLNFLNPTSARPPSRLHRSESAPAHKRPISNPKTNPYLDRDNMVLPAIRQQQLRQHQPRMRQHSDDYDSRLPRIDHGNTPPGNRFDEDPAENANGDYDVMDENENEEQAIYRLHPKDLSQLTQAINTFGAKLVGNCTSKQWQNRHKGLQDLLIYLDQHRFLDREDAYSVLTPALQLLQRALKDKIFNVYKEAIIVLRYVLLTFIPKYKIAKTGGPLVAERTYYTLITRAGDSISDPRFRPTSMEFAESAVAKTDTQIGKSYASCFLRPFQASGHQKIDQAHAEIAERIITTNEAPNSHVDLIEEKICPFAVSCLQHTDATVRQSGIRIFSYIYKMGNREKVRRYLPRNNEGAKKKWPLYKTIFEEFDRIDGKMGPNHVAPLVKRQQSFNDPSEFEQLKRENDDLKRQLTWNSGMRQMTPSSAITVATYASTPNQEYPENTEPICVFCGEANRTFDEENLDMHYLMYCPMLTKCQLCKKVVEISALKEHFTEECSGKDMFRQCPRCKEPLLNDEYNRHQVHKRCQPVKNEINVEQCLLCHKDVSPNNEDGWRNHLIGANGCPANPRKSYGIGLASMRRNSTGGNF